MDSRRLSRAFLALTGVLSRPRGELAQREIDDAPPGRAFLLWEAGTLTPLSKTSVLDGLEREFGYLPRARPWTWTGLARLRTHDSFTILCVTHLSEAWRLNVVVFPERGGSGTVVAAGIARGERGSEELSAPDRLEALQGQVEAYLDRLGRCRGQPGSHP